MFDRIEDVSSKTYPLKALCWLVILLLLIIQKIKRDHNKWTLIYLTKTMYGMKTYFCRQYNSVDNHKICSTILFCRKCKKFTLTCSELFSSNRFINFNVCEIIITKLVNFRAWKLNFYKILKIALTFVDEIKDYNQLYKKQNSINKPINEHSPRKQGWRCCK